MSAFDDFQKGLVALIFLTVVAVLAASKQTSAFISTATGFVANMAKKVESA